MSRILYHHLSSSAFLPTKEVYPSSRNALRSTNRSSLATWSLLATRPQQSVQQCTPAIKRHLHSSTRRQKLQEQKPLVTDESPIQDLPIRRTWGTNTAHEPRLPRQSFIRHQLRAWSEQNKKKVQDEAPDVLPAKGRPATLPKSLFSDELEELDADYDEEVAEYDDSLEGNSKLQLLPGDVIHLNIPHIRSQLAVFLGQIDRQYQFLLRDGRWAVGHVPVPEELVLRGYASEDEIEAIRQFLPKKAVQRPSTAGMSEEINFAGELPSTVSTPILDRLEKMAEDVLVFVRRHSDVLDRIYEICSHEVHYETFTLAELTKRLFQKDLSDMADGDLAAIFGALRRNTVKIQTLRCLPEEMAVIFTPKRLFNQFEQVTKWARDYQESAAQAALGKDVAETLKRNPLNTFIDKARRLIIQSRKTRSPTTIGVLGPSSIHAVGEESIEVRDTGEIYSEQDKMVLEFLWDTYLRRPMPKRKNANHSIGSLILRAIGAYPDLRLERKIGRLLLQELGSLAPWNESADESVIIPVPGRRGAHIADRLYEDSERAAQELGFDGLLAEVPMTDSMAHLRKDWGDIDVLCIDKPGTKVLDDGISLEPAKDSPGAFWIHVHIAHPTAYFSPDHVFGRRGRHFGLSLYTSRQSYQMLPDFVAQTMSLGPNKAVLTVSSLLMPNGEVKEIKMSAGTLRRVTRLDPRAVDKLLGRQVKEKVVFVVGHQTPHAPELLDESTRLVHQHSDTLKTIERLLATRMKHRQQQVPEYADWMVPDHDFEIKLSFLEPYDATRLHRSYHYFGDPTIKVVSDRNFELVRLGERFASEPLTAHAMILASESAGRWLSERKIPAVFSGALTNPEYPLSRMNKATRYETSLQPTIKTSSKPVPHAVLTIPAYVRITSPLRRYTDQVGQWQIDSYLKAEAEGSLELDDTGTPLNLPFTADMIEKHLQLESQAVDVIDKLMKVSMIHWAFQALFRAFHFKETPLPEIWDMQVVNMVATDNEADDSRMRGNIHPFKLKAHLLKSKEGWENSARYSQWLPVKIELVDPATTVVYVRAVGPPSDSPTQTVPTEISRRPSGEPATPEDVNSGLASKDAKQISDP